MAQTISETSSAVSRSQIASTLPYLRNVIRDNVTDTTPLLSFLMGKLGGQARTLVGMAGNTGDGLPGVIVGGRDIMVPVQLKANETVGSFSGADPLDITHQDTDEYALFGIKQIAGSMVITGRERRGNKGAAQIYSLLEAKTNRLIEDMRVECNTQAIADGTGNGGKDLTGLGAIVSTATLGGLSPTTYPKWQPGGFASGNSRHAIVSTVTFSSGGLTNMHQQMDKITFGTDGPDGIFASRTVIESYFAIVDANMQYTSTDVADASFKTTTFQGVKMYFDHGFPTASATGVMYFLNSRHIAFQRDTAADFDWIDDGVRPADQDTMAKIMLVEGNIVTDNRRMLAVTSAIT